MKAPSSLGEVAFEVSATSGAFTDGERRTLPILPGRVHLAQSRFAVLKGSGVTKLSFDDLRGQRDPTRINDKLVVTVDGQLFYGVLSALPYLINYPYECTEQTLNRFLATGILSSLFTQYPAVAKVAKKLSQRDSVFERWDDADPNRRMALEETPWLRQLRGGMATDFERVLDPKVAAATRNSSLAKLKKAQTRSGGFPWFPGGRPSSYITIYLLHGFAKALEFGVEVDKPMVQAAWRYLRYEYIEEAVNYALEHDCCWEPITFLNYALSSFPDPSWSNNSFSPELQQAMLNLSFKHWKSHSPYLKGYLALNLLRSDREEDALLVWESVLDSAESSDDEGTHWAAEDRSWLWYNDTIESHAFALRTTMELKPKWEKLDGLVLWLFLNKKLNHWKSTRATAEVIYALAGYLRNKGQLQASQQTKVEVGSTVQTFVFDPNQFTGTQQQLVVSGESLGSEHATTTLTTRSPEGGYQLASSTWHYSTEQLPQEAEGDFLGVTRSYYRRVITEEEVELQPLKEGAALAVGDEVEIQLSITAKHPMEYVHLRDPRGAGFEPITLVSGHRWDLGISWYEEVRDSGTNFFFERLPQGEYTFKYRVRATTAGAFKLGPATLSPIYAPEMVAYSSGVRLSVQAQ